MVKKEKIEEDGQLKSSMINGKQQLLQMDNK